jgi:hypothetical protein
MCYLPCIIIVILAIQKDMCIFRGTFTDTICCVGTQPLSARHNIKKEHFGQFFSTLGQRFLAGGDYNSKNVLWSSRLTTTKGKELAKLVQDNNYSYISSGTPTYWPTDPVKIPDLLDFFVTKGISPGYTDIVPSFNLSSDHTPIIATISSSVTIRHYTPRLHNYKINCEKYREEITNNINPKIKLKTQEDLELAIETLTKVMQQAATQSTPPLERQKTLQQYSSRNQTTFKRKAKGESNVAPNAHSNR